MANIAGEEFVIGTSGYLVAGGAGFFLGGNDDRTRVALRRIRTAHTGNVAFTQVVVWPAGSGETNTHRQDLELSSGNNEFAVTVPGNGEKYYAVSDFSDGVDAWHVEEHDSDDFSVLRTLELDFPEEETRAFFANALITPDGSTLYASTRQSNYLDAIRVIDVSSFAEVDTLPLPVTPVALDPIEFAAFGGMALSPDGETLYVTMRVETEGAEVRYGLVSYDTGTNAVIDAEWQTISGGATIGQVVVLPDGLKAYWGYNDKLYEADTSDLSTLRTFTLPSGYLVGSLAINSDGDKLALYYDGHLLILDIEDFTADWSSAAATFGTTNIAFAWFEYRWNEGMLTPGGLSYHAWPAHSDNAAQIRSAIRNGTDNTYRDVIDDARNPSLWFDTAGAWWMAATRQSDDCAALWRSYDEGETWEAMTEMVEIWDDAYRYGRVLPIHGGILLSVATKRLTDPVECWFRRSEDGGQTWSEPVKVGNFEGFDKMAHLLQKQDGAIMVFNHESLIWQSLDGGATWDEAETTP